MNILFILTNYPGVGGIEKVTTLLANEFSKRGNNVYIVSVNAIEGSANIEELSDKVKAGNAELSELEQRQRELLLCKAQILFW